MAQSRAARLAPVVDMAERAEREAALQLGRCQGLLRQAEVQLGDLERYRGDYQQQWISEGQRGVSGQWLMNYQRFLTQLETAIGQQRTSVDWPAAHQRRLAPQQYGKGARGLAAALCAAGRGAQIGQAIPG